MGDSPLPLAVERRKHVICCVASAIYELGIDPVFCGGEPHTTAILKFPGVG
jgi:hypothetical protein